MTIAISRVCRYYCARMAATTGTPVGTALRAIRRRRGLSLADVSDRSGNEFKASSIGAYERGDREISVTRLRRLAEVYGVSVESLLQPSTAYEIDLSRLERLESSGLVIDLSRFRLRADPGAAIVMDFATAIKGMRKEATSSVLVVRRSDTPVLAALLGCDPTAVDTELAHQAVLSGR